MLNRNDIICYDFETGSANPYTCEPLQLAAVILDARTLEIKPDSEFATYIKPTSWDNVEDGALAVNKIKREVVEKDGISQKEAWETFTRYVNKYNKSKTPFGAPISAGHNIKNFDRHITDRMCRLYGPVDKKDSPIIFHRRDMIDLMDISFLWFENTGEPENYKLDTIRGYLGVSKENAHNAVTDVQHTAMIIARFLKFHRTISSKTIFKGCFAND